MTCVIYADTWSKKNLKLPEEVAISSGKKIWFDCHTCKHEYEQTPNSKTGGSGCPYCSNSKLCGSLYCLFCLKKSCYVYKNIWRKENKISSWKVAINSDKKILFNCSKCKHEYYQSPNNKRKGKGCPFCSNQKLCGRLDCEFCLYKSCYDYKDIWSGKNINKDGVYIKPETVAINSNIKYIFKCHICNHNYEQTPSSKTQGCGCPYCSNTFNKLCGSLECAFCLPKSCYIYADTWSDKNKISPLEVSINSRKNYIFNCNVCKEYNQKPSNKTRGCPKCVNKTEGLVAEYLKATNINFTQQYKIGNIRKYYDFYLIDYKLIIEVDGAQHFRQVRNWGNPEENLENDIQKMKVAMTKGISILRIYQPDIWLNKIDWKACINENLYKRTTPDVTTVASNPEIYNNHAV